MTLRAALQIVTADSTLNLDHVHRYTYVDRTCDLFELTIEVGSDDPAMGIVALLRAVADFRSKEEPKPFRVRGIVKSVDQLSAEPGGSSRYRVVIVPEMWVLTLNRRRRIFQDRNVLETLVQVLSECGATSTVKVVPSQMEPHDAVPYRTQYDESDFTFLRRILLEEGFVFFLGRTMSEEDDGIEPTDNPAIYLFDDSTKVHLTVELPYQPLADGAMASAKGLRANRFSPGAIAVPEEAVTRDYDHLRPGLLLEGRASRLVSNAKRDTEVFQFGSFGSGKSHFMAVLSLLAGNETRAWTEPKVHDLYDKHAWVKDKKVLRLHLNMIDARTLGNRLFSAYLDHTRKQHPDASVAPLFADVALFDNARSLRAQLGDDAFLRS